MSSDETPGYFGEKAKGYFDFLAKIGLTKHLGSMAATRELIELSHIHKGQLVLEVGCGVGATVSYLAKSLDCRVVGVDVVPRMIEQARERAQAEKIASRVAFTVADARALPFADHLFDAVIMESVNVFFEEKSQALREYVRVTRPGGYVGLTEMTWLAAPSAEVAAYYQRMVYAKALQAAGWKRLLAASGLQDVAGSARPVDLSREAKGRMERYGCRGMLRVMARTAGLLFKDQETRTFMKDVTGSLPRDLMKDMGYGVYAGRKAS
jgi:ubiquinone/menaquinone biosynthesis C-methylase UbiE